MARPGVWDKTWVGKPVWFPSNTKDSEEILSTCTSLMSCIHGRAAGPPSACLQELGDEQIQEHPSVSPLPVMGCAPQVTLV